MNRTERDQLTVAELRPWVMASESGLFDGIVGRAAKAIERDQKLRDEEERLRHEAGAH